MGLVKPESSLFRPRPIPSRMVPSIFGGVILLLALPVFLVTGWPITAWVLGLVLWLASEALGLVFQRLPLGVDKLATSGVVGFGMMSRGILVMIVCIAVAVSRPHVGLGAALLYAVAYSAALALSLLSYFTGESSK